MTSSYVAQCVYLGAVDATASGIKEVGPIASYIKFTKPNLRMAWLYLYK